MCITRRNSKKASRSLSLSELWPERSRICDGNYPAESVDDHFDHFDREISLFLEKYVKPCAQSTNSKHDSGSYSMGSESASVSIVSSSSVICRKISPNKVKSNVDRTKNRDTVATVITIIQEQYIDNPKYRSKANPLSRSHTLPSLSRSSCKTRVSLNGHSYKYNSDI